MSRFVSEAIFGTRWLFVPGLLKVDFYSSPVVFGFSASVIHPVRLWYYCFATSLFV